MFPHGISCTMIRFACWNINGFKLEKLEKNIFIDSLIMLVFLKVGQMLSQQWISQDIGQY